MVGTAPAPDPEPMSANLPPEDPERPVDDTSETRRMDADAGPVRRFLRSRTDRVLAGVSGGLGRYLGVDPIVIRIAFVALTLFGGAGALLYLAMALLVPVDDQVPGGAGPAKATQQNRGLVVLGVIVLVVVVGPLLFIPALFAGGVVVPLAVLILLGLGVAWLVTGKRPERNATALTKATILGLGFLALLGVLAVAGFWGAGLGGETLVAIVVILCGVALLAGAFVKPVRWLILPALALAIPASFASAAGVDLDGGYGEKTYRPATIDQLSDRYELGAGQLVVDLRGIDFPAGEHALNVQVGMGEVVVIVPKDVCVSTNGDAGIGAVSSFAHEVGGVDVDFVDDRTPKAAAPHLTIDAETGIGHIEIRNTPRQSQDRVPRVDQDGVNWNIDTDTWRDDRGRNTACAR